MHFTYHVLLLLIFVLSAYSASISGQNSDGSYTCYECLATDCENPFNQTCNGLSCFTSIKLLDKRRLLYEKGCHVNPFISLSCQLIYNATNELTNCCEGNFCNNDEFPSIPAHWYPSNTRQLEAGEISSTHGVLYSLWFVLIVVAICFICCIPIGVFNKKSNIDTLLGSLNNQSSIFSHDTSFPSPGSGCSGLNLNQRCMSQDVKIMKCLGKGRFGAVYRATFHDEDVAVKIFPTTEEASWKNEVNIYTKIALYHENLLGFKGSVIATRLGSPELWLFTAYHKQGSLYDYLSENTITHNEMIKFVRSICSGLLHLHTEIVGSQGKPAIAHRDLKGRNILLTSQGTCVISDFGLAIVKSDEFSNKDKPINYKVGTKRYMAPEILDDSIKVNSFESFKRIDIYAFGLILWEISSRCTEDGIAEAYHLPYHDCVPNNPDFADMKKIVCIESKRPEIPDSWSCNKPLNSMATLMKECWHKNPEIRPTAYRVKKILDKIHADMQELQSTAQPA